MEKGQFRMSLESAISGDNQALEAILKLYKPLIDSYSCINGKLDEDLRQHILMYITAGIKTFKIEN